MDQRSDVVPKRVTATILVAVTFFYEVLFAMRPCPQYNTKAMKKILLVIGVLLVFGRISVSFAQNGMGQSASNTDDFSPVKTEVAGLLRDNKELQSRYNQLILQKDTLEEKLNAFLSDNRGIQDEMTAAQEEGREKSRGIVDLQAELRRVHAVAAAKREQNVVLQAKMRDIDEKKDIRELKLRDLEYEKKDFEAEVAILQKDYNAKLYDHQGGIAKLQEQFRQIEDEKENIEKERRDMDAVTADLPNRLPVVQSEVASLTSEVDELTAKKSLLAKEIMILKDKKLLAEKMYAVKAAPLVDKQQKLKQQVASLEEEYQQLSKNIQRSLDSQKHRRELMNDIIRLDKENQELRNKAEALN